MKRVPLLAFILIALGCASGPQKKREYSVIFDSAKLLNSVQHDSLRAIISELEQNVGSQIGVNIIPSLRGQNIDEYSIQVADRLGLGRKKFNDGILLTIAIEDRMMRIEVGTGLEIIVRDEIASRINREVMAPKFRKGNYCLGIYKGIDSLKSLIESNKGRIGEIPEHRKKRLN